MNESWAIAAVDALMELDQARFDAVLAVLDSAQLSALSAQLEAAAGDDHSAFDHLLYRAGSAMCDAALKGRLSSFDANGSYIG